MSNLPKTLLMQVLHLAMTAVACNAQTQIASLRLIADPPTLTAIGFRLEYSGDDNRNATVTWQYRTSGGWFRTPHPMLRVLPETVPARPLTRHFAGSIFDLRPGTAYEVQVTVQDPDGSVNITLTGFSTTRNVPGGPANPRNISVNSISTLKSALSGAQPGDIITVNEGDYRTGPIYIYASGTEANPIILRGVSQSGTVLDGGGCRTCNVLEIYGDYFRVEDLTLQNALQAIRFQGTSAKGNVVRRVTIRDVTSGINGRGVQSGFYIADNTLQGRLSFPLSYSSDRGANSDRYGIAVFGSGHVVAHNHISGFANSITNSVVGARGNDFYGNEISYSYDDAIEIDGSEGNIRVLRNRFTNVYVGISVQPVLGGPAYLIRNVGYNIKYEPMKFHRRATTPPEDPSGVLVYHNTFVSTDRALNMAATANNYNSVLMNNIFLGPDITLSNMPIYWEALLNNVKFDYNGYYPDYYMFFRTSPTAPVANNFNDLFPKYGLEEHGRLLQGAATLAAGVVGPPSFMTLRAPLDATLPPSNSLALDSGTALVGINDDYQSTKPDFGALERGCAVPYYGPRPPGVDESNASFDCVAPDRPPSVVSALPVNGSGSSQVFRIVATDAQGASTLSKVSATFGASTVLANSCSVELDRASGAMYLWNDTGSSRLGPLASGANATLRNSQCTINGTGSSVQALNLPNQLVWNMNVTFRDRSVKSIFLKADDVMSTSGWRNMGTWK